MGSPGWKVYTPNYFCKIITNFLRSSITIFVKLYNSSMQVNIIWPWDLTENINGIAVVCDVWAATTNINTLLSKQVGRLFLVNQYNVQEAKRKYRKSLVIGQSLKLPKDFFDTSNNPYDVANARVKNKTVLYMTNNGTRIIELALAKKASKVISVSFSNLNCLAEYLRGFEENVYLIPAGEVEFANPKVIEDKVCLQTLKKFLKGGVADIGRSEKIALDFIKKAYGYQRFDQKRNFEIVFKTNDLQIIPLCERTRNNWISVSNIYPRE